jgi:rare lipoprotein A
MKNRIITLLVFTVLFWLSSFAFVQKQTGIASYYADKFEGQLTASGEKYKHKRLTAAHKILPFGTLVKVTNIKNGKSVEVTINDRGPFVSGRIIDLSKSAAEALQFTAQGLTEVELEVVDAGDGKVKNTQMQIDDPLAEDIYFSLKVERENPEGYGVQIASFRSLDNLMRLAENIRKSYGEVPFVEVKDINGEKVYAIVIGKTNNRKKVEVLKQSVKERFPDAFVITY